MRDLVEHINSVLRAHTAKKVIVACSAGLDSTVLFHACSQLNLPLELAHVNYQLRGEDSEMDAEFVQQLANSYHTRFHLKRIDLNQYLTHGGNLQKYARDLRYEFFDTLTRNQEDCYVLLAHHKEDQTETFFMNLARNSGIMGLSAMPVQRDNIIRPLLDISKEELRAYALRNSISWREDASNATLKYTRNQWRHKVLPELRKSLPSLDESVQHLVKAFQRTQTEIESKVAQIVSEIYRFQKLSLEQFQEMSTSERIELCRQIGQPFGILHTWEKLEHKGTGIDLVKHPNCPYHRIVLDDKCFTFLSEELKPLPSLRIETISELPKFFTKDVLFIDHHRVSGALHVRKPQPGDRIAPIGMKGTRLISDVVSDAKLDSLQKKNFVIVSDDEHILWVPGLCVGRHAVATPQSSSIKKVTLISK
jgi:tRNA(Ile)-lysidine synthase